MTGGAVVFLNPEIILPRLVPSTGADGLTITGVRNAPPQANGSVELLNDLCHAVGAIVVLTRLTGLGDPRVRLFRLGLKAAMPTAWFTDPTIPDPAVSIPAWLALNVGLPSITINRPGVGPLGGVRIDVPAGAEITAPAIRAAANALQGLS